MWSEIVGIIGDVIGSTKSKGASEDYQDRLQGILGEQKNQNLEDAKRLFADLSMKGLPGVETMRERLRMRLPETINQATDWLSGPMFVDFLAQNKANVDEQLQILDEKDSLMKLQNKTQQAAFLGGPAAQIENQLLSNKNWLNVMSAYLPYQQAGVQNDYLQNILGTAGGLIDMDWSKMIALLSKGDKNTGGTIEDVLNAI